MGAYELRGSSEGITILAKNTGILLDRLLLDVTEDGELAALEQLVDGLSGLDLTRMRASSLVNEGVVRC